MGMCEEMTEEFQKQTQYDDLMEFLTAKSTEYLYNDTKEHLLRYLNSVSKVDRHLVNVYKGLADNSWNTVIVGIDGVIVDENEYRIDLEYDMIYNKPTEVCGYLITKVCIYGEKEW